MLILEDENKEFLKFIVKHCKDKSIDNLDEELLSTLREAFGNKMLILEDENKEFLKFIVEHCKDKSIDNLDEELLSTLREAFDKKDINEDEVNEDYYSKAMIDMSNDNTVGFVDNIKNVFLMKLSEDEDYMKLSDEMAFYKSED